jgi:hypothetical protein
MSLYTQFKDGRPTENMIRCPDLQWYLMCVCVCAVYVAPRSPVDEGIHTTCNLIETVVDMVNFFQ